MSSYTVFELTADPLRPAEALESWSAHIHANQGGLDSKFTGVGAFTGTTIVQRSGEYQLVEFHSSEIAYERTDRQARKDDDRSVRIVMSKSGPLRLQTKGEAISLEHGEMALFTMSAGVVLSHPQTTSAWIFSVPESAWPTSSTLGGARAIDTSIGMGAVTAEMLRQLSAQRSSLGGADFLTVSTHIAQLAAATDAAQDFFPFRSIASAARDLAVLHADDVTFSPRALALLLGWSLRTVQVCLREAGTTPAELIRSVRLSNARRRLANPAESFRSISDIAHASGFGSISGFNSAFLGEFGITPRAVSTVRLGGYETASSRESATSRAGGRYFLAQSIKPTRIGNASTPAAVKTYSSRERSPGRPYGRFSTRPSETSFVSLFASTSLGIVSCARRSVKRRTPTKNSRRSKRVHRSPKMPATVLIERESPPNAGTSTSGALPRI